ncbi:unnamed protein product [Ranitomeya imitator]|uniref:ribonuclease H n=1 Tax=Ranitomeya imitator TaxID=111125 RepID=A0ABN9M886_9NEOB|nr:unnamed protein product [Ranitomeya imitator]
MSPLDVQRLERPQTTAEEGGETDPKRLQRKEERQTPKDCRERWKRERQTQKTAEKGGETDPKRLQRKEERQTPKDCRERWRDRPQKTAEKGGDTDPKRLQRKEERQTPKDCRERWRDRPQKTAEKGGRDRPQKTAEKGGETDPKRLQRKVERQTPKDCRERWRDRPQKTAEKGGRNRPQKTAEKGGETDSKRLQRKEKGQVYNDPDRVSLAESTIRHLTQGDRPVEKYCSEFRRWATDTKWNDPALRSQFYQGLSDKIKDAFALQETATTLEAAMSLAIRVDRRLRQRLSESPLFKGNSDFDSPESESLGEPMQLGGASHSKGAAVVRRKEGKPQFFLPTEIRLGENRFNISAFLDSGAGFNLIDAGFVQAHGLKTQELSRPIPIIAIDSAPLSQGTFTQIVRGSSSQILRMYSLRRGVESYLHTVLYDCAIRLIPGAKLPKSRLYNISAPERQAMKDYITESLAKGHIRPSSSPIAAGFFFVKKDGGLRPCLDFRELNQITVRDSFSLPLIPDLFNQIVGAKWFSKLDLRVAYNLIRMKEGDEWKTAFNTPEGHYENLVMPFGLSNAPAVFQHFVNDIFSHLIGRFVVVYLDDILIYSPDLESHQDHVRQVLQVLRDNKLFVKLEKCMFVVKEIPFLGYFLSSTGFHMDPSKVRADLEWDRPEDLKALQRFLGFANFYRKFIKDFSVVAKPLTDMTKRGTDFSVWSSAASKAFETLKKCFFPLHPY